MTTLAELRAFQRQERAKVRRAVTDYADAIVSGDREMLVDAIERLEMTGGWPATLRRIARVGKVHPNLPPSLLAFWIECGDSLRTEAGHDRDLLDALWVMLPPYRGPGLTLYRGDGWCNRRHRTYGAAWSAREDVAEGFALSRRELYRGGSVVLCTVAPPEAIICQVHGTEGDRFEEAEYLVDRRRLGRVEIMCRYEHAPMPLSNMVTRSCSNTDTTT